MLHYGKTPHGELQITATEEDIAVIYRAVCSAHLTERGTVHPVVTYIEENFREEISRGVRPASTEDGV